MFYSDLVSSALLARRQVKMLWLEETLVQQSLLYIVFVELLLARVFEQILIQILHHTVLDAFTIQSVLVRWLISASNVHLVAFLWWENLVECLRHFSHQFLYLFALLFPCAVILNYFWQSIPHEDLN